jgi:hypothetical protein
MTFGSLRFGVWATTSPSNAQSGLRCTMANKAITASVAAKKPGKTLKEKRAAKAVKAVEKTASRKTWENK